MRAGESIVADIVRDPDKWHRLAYPTASYDWQVEVCKNNERLIDLTRRGVIQPGLEAVTIVARQGGKNELSARNQARLLFKYANENFVIVRVAPTYRPQLIISMQRLEQQLKHFRKVFNEGRDLHRWIQGYQCQVGDASVIFLSGETHANRVGHTASGAIEVDEAQDVATEIYDKDLRPMGLTTGAPSFLFGTVWSDDTLLEQKRRQAKEMEKHYKLHEHGVKLCFEVDADEIGRCNETYRRTFAYELARLGREHPVIKTQYYLEAVSELDKFIPNRADYERMRGLHPRQNLPREGSTYVAGVDLSGSIETDLKDQIKNVDARGQRDSTVVTIGELRWMASPADPSRKLPIVVVVDHLLIKDRPPLDTVNRIYQYIFEKWRCAYAVIDASGVGDYPAQMILGRRPQQVTALKSTMSEVSRLGFNLLGAIMSGRFLMYRDHEDSEEHRQFWLQMKECRRELKSNSMMRFYAPERRMMTEYSKKPVDIHDDFVKSASYCLDAAERHMLSAYDPVSNARRAPAVWSPGGYS